jgi:hypothetical protein
LGAITGDDARDLQQQIANLVQHLTAEQQEIDRWIARIDVDVNTQRAAGRMKGYANAPQGQTVQSQTQQ